MFYSDRFNDFPARVHFGLSRSDPKRLSLAQSRDRKVMGTPRFFLVRSKHPRRKAGYREGQNFAGRCSPGHRLT